MNPAENNAFKAINRAWRAGASVRWMPGATAADGRYVISGLDPAAQDALVSALALHAERVAAPDAKAARGRASACSSARPAWTKAGRG